MKFNIAWIDVACEHEWILNNDDVMKFLMRMLKVKCSNVQAKFFSKQCQILCSEFDKNVLDDQVDVRFWH